ncbi:MAG: thiamine-phosphate kinase [Euryarchaeota archaeon]|nr:thiamine-phosphate kinase [Euryarchaeota archaeon]MBV1728984.1 thiamine-phosphate kinase [Methanobacterium sp.]MBU4548100.1 thiamine-phosphate kinase [Euryarchaeota archaeon]MBU4607997.1 thiamine-phosphate kinase [Euryarchaeota archaeon]MBV1755201.1 thiamine-phosphate kinase [Methanobacterium sp.]
MPSKKHILSEVGEKKLIERIIKKTRDLQQDYYSKHPHIKKSLGDDAALMDLSELKPSNNFLVVSSDMLLAKTHFPSQMKPRERGWKIVTVNVSDISAMGAIPQGLILSIGLPGDMETKHFDELMEGVLEACNYYQIPLIGGDTNESSQMVLSGTIIGSVEKSKVLMKSGAQPGDLVAVSGDLGLAAAGFEILLSSTRDQQKIKSILPEKIIKKALKQALKPEAKIKEGIIAAQSGQISAATDITDGLASELEEIIKASNLPLGIRIYEDKIPLTDEVKKIGEFFSKKPLDMALHYGEDFELLFCIKKDALASLKDKIQLMVVGEVTSTGNMEIVNKKGKINILPPGGYQHLEG